ILILSVTRNGEIILPKGYTRLRKHDIVTVVGSQEQIDLVRTKLQF
ncbi:MAG: TrkA C-terminal domain-containing protein, partial [Bacteroidales bacterium]|nr:TrkA C-terminal domain-containing protein [Bacteroidales bacterium]